MQLLNRGIRPSGGNEGQTKKLIPARSTARILTSPCLEDTTDSLETVWRLGVSGWLDVRGTRG